MRAANVPAVMLSETFAEYRAKSIDFDHAVNGTVFGELRVSKSLLEGEIPGHKVTFFRAGHLRVPPPLPQSLEQSEYEFDSSFTADDLLGGYPFPMTRDMDFATETRVFEFPVTIEDEETPLLTRIPQTLDTINANSGGRNEEQLKQNLGATGWQLTPKQHAKLEEASRTPAPYPNWHQAQFIADRAKP